MDYPTPDQVDAATARLVEAWTEYLPPPRTGQERAVFDRLTARRRSSQRAREVTQLVRIPQSGQLR